MIVTVTLNAAVDRSLTVPNFQRGQRHRASAGLTLAGGKGINVARALKLLGVPVVATGFVGGATGTRIVEELTREAVLNDFVRIERRVAHVDGGGRPRRRHVHRDQRVGAVGSEEELGTLREKLHYLTQGAEVVVFAGSLPRSVEDEFYAEATRDLARRHVPAVLDSEGEPLRLGLEAEPFLVSPNQREAEALVGQEFHDEEDFRLALERIARARRAQRPDHDRGGLRGPAARGAREPRLFRAVAPHLEAVSVVGAGDVLLAAFLAARHVGRSPEESLRAAVAAGAASTLEVGAGRFDSRQAGRLQAGVQVVELAPVEA